MDWTSTGVAAVAGGLSALIGSLLGALVDKLQRGEAPGARVAVWLPIVFAIVGAQLAGAMFRNYQSSPTHVEAELIADERVGSLASAWRESEPESFSVLVDGVAAAVRDGRNYDEAVDQVRAELMSAAMPRMRYLDDASMVEVARVARDECAELSESRPQICHPMFNGAAYGDVTPYLSEQLVRRELALLTSAFRADASTQRRAFGGEELDAAVRQALDDARQAVGADVDLLVPGAPLAGREAQYCRAIASFFESVVATPESEAAALMRGLQSVE